MARAFTLIVAIVALSVITSTPTLATSQAAACATTGTPTSTVFLPNVTKTLGGSDGWVTPFIVQNVGAANTHLDISFFRFADGAGIACHSVSALVPRASYADIPNNDADLPDDTQFAVLIQSFGAPVTAAVNEVRGDEAASYDGSASGSLVSYLPNIARRYFGFDTPFIVQNVGTLPATATGSFVSFDGTQHLSVPLSLAPGRSRAIDPNYTSGLVDGTQYSVTVRSDQPVVVIVNTVNLDVPMVSAYQGFTGGGATLFAPYFIKDMPREGSSPIVVMNVGTAPTQPKLTVIYAPGPYWCTTGSCPNDTFSGAVLQPGATLVFDPRTLGVVDPAEAGAIVRAVVPGTSTPDPNAQLAAVVLPTSDTVTMAYQAKSPTALDSYFFPNVVKGLGGAGGWTTRLVVLTDSLVEIAGSFYSFDTGQQVGAGGFDVRAGFPQDNPDGTPTSVAGIVTIDPWSYSFLAPDSQYSVVMTPVCPGFVVGPAGTVREPQTHIYAVAIVTADGGDNEMIYEGTPGTRTQLFRDGTGPCS